MRYADLRVAFFTYGNNIVKRRLTCSVSICKTYVTPLNEALF